MVFYWKTTTSDMKSVHIGRSRKSKMKLQYGYKWIYPEKGTYYFVFKRLKDATAFLKTYEEQGNLGNRTFKCIVKNPKKHSCQAMLNSGAVFNDRFSLKEILLFWEPKTRYGAFSSYDLSRTPRGTYICEGVKLIKEIKT